MRRSSLREDENSQAGPSRSRNSENHRAKRGKYVSKACEYCHRRKIKCDGDIPCQSCIAKGRECSKDFLASNPNPRGKKRALTADQAEEIDMLNMNSNNPAVEMLLHRLGQLEQQVNLMSSNTATTLLQDDSQQDEYTRQSSSVPANNTPLQTIDHGVATDVPQDEALAHSTFKETRDAFVGETSINQTLQHVERSLQESRVQTGNAQRPLTNSYLSPCTEGSGAKEPVSDRTWLRRIISKHRIKPHKEEWDTLLDLFCEDVHCFYPFFHLPSLRRAYSGLWDSLSPAISTNEPPTLESVDAVVQVLVCLALGRCTTSVRADTAGGTHSAGWSFYCAAMEVLGNVLDPLGEGPHELMRLQTLAIMVIYLLRLDAMERAQKVLSLAIVHGHHLGLHREKVLESMPVFYSEASRRTWWSIYVLDRRIALDIGRPFLIQDTNIDTKVPFNFSDSWLGDREKELLPMSSIHPELEAGLKHDEQTSLPYLTAMVGYSKIVGKVWDALYQANAMDRASNTTLFESFEVLLSMWQQSLPAELHCDDANAHIVPSNLLYPWQAKNRFLIYLRTIWLRILIRKPLRRQATPTDWLESFDNESTCIALAEKIVDLFSRIFEAHRVYTFPFLQYLLGAASIILGLIIKIPTFKPKYSDAVIRAVQMINNFCRKTWVSGKTARSIAKLTRIATKTLGYKALTATRDEADRTTPTLHQQYHRAQRSTAMSNSNLDRRCGRDHDLSGPQAMSSGEHTQNRAHLPSPSTLVANSNLEDCIRLDTEKSAPSLASANFAFPSPRSTTQSSANQQWFDSSNMLSMNWPTEQQQLVTSDFPFESSLSHGIVQLAVPANHESDSRDLKGADWFEKLTLSNDTYASFDPDLFSGGW